MTPARIADALNHAYRNEGIRWSGGYPGHRDAVYLTAMDADGYYQTVFIDCVKLVQADNLSNLIADTAESLASQVLAAQKQRNSVVDTTTVPAIEGESFT